jgi:hypothetical protein
MITKTKTLVVQRIKKESDRQLLYAGEDQGVINYHVIAGVSDQVAIGDKIEYEPYGINFGWFVAKTA